MKENESPHIELYMYSLNQEFPAGKGHVTFLKKRSELLVDEKTGKFFTVQEVESQVYFTGRDERPLTGRNERLASEKVEIPPFPPSSGSPRKISQERLRLRGLQNGCKTGGWLNGFRIRPTSTHERHTPRPVGRIRYSTLRSEKRISEAFCTIPLRTWYTR